MKGGRTGPRSKAAHPPAPPDWCPFRRPSYLGSDRDRQQPASGAMAMMSAVGPPRVYQHNSGGEETTRSGRLEPTRYGPTDQERLSLPLGTRLGAGGPVKQPGPRATQAAIFGTLPGCGFAPVATGPRFLAERLSDIVDDARQDGAHRNIGSAVRHLLCHDNAVECVGGSYFQPGRAGTARCSAVRPVGRGVPE